MERIPRSESGAVKTLEQAQERIDWLEKELAKRDVQIFLLTGERAASSNSDVQTSRARRTLESDADAGMRRDPLRLFFATPRIFHRILKELSPKDLLTCSLVSKAWCREARTALTDWKTSFALVGRTRHACLDLLNLNNEVVKMKTVPFNSLSICMRRHTHTNLRSLPDLKEYFLRLCQFKWKNLRVTWEGGADCSDCPAIQWVKSILRNSEQGLVGLSLDGVPENIDIFGYQTGSPARLPQLKHCELQRCIFDSILPNLTVVAPNLERLVASLTTDDLVHLPRNRFNVVKNIRVAQGPISDVEILKVFAASNPQVEELNAYDTMDHCRSNLYYLQPLRMILESSWETLKKLNICALELRKLLEGQSVILRSLEVLVLWISEYVVVETDGIRFLFEALNIPERFPTCRYLSIGPHSCKCDHFDRNEIKVPGKEGFGGGPSLTISQLVLEQFGRELPVSYLAGRFPAVTTIVLKFHHVHGIHNVTSQLEDWEALPRFWESFGNLKSMTILTDDDYKEDFNVDSIFCGIHPEEAEYLMDQFESPALLSCLHVVPIKSGIYVATKLTELRVRFSQPKVTDVSDYVDQYKPDGELVRRNHQRFFLSRISGALAFQQRNPDLHVQLEYHGSQFGALNHFAPYANVSYSD